MEEGPMAPPNVGLREKAQNYLIGTKVLNGSKTQLIYIILLRLLKKWFPSRRLLFDKLLKGSSDRKFLVRNVIGTFCVSPVNDSLAKAMPHFEKTCHHWLKNDRTHLFVDIGANTGFYTILATGRYGYDKALSFEPNPEVYRTLEQNLKLNGLQTRVRCFNLALGEKRQVLPFCRYASHTGLSRFIESESEIKHKDREDHEIVEIETVSFDDFVTTHDINVMEIDFVKIDVEGFEYNVLKGMRRTLSLISNVKLFVEINPKNKNREQTTDLLSEFGFIAQDRTGMNHLFVKGL
jgi:FkbM family methyltransferase